MSKVVLFPYNSKMPAIFNKEKRRIVSHIPEINDIHHVGSSAIPGLLGKNIVDILIGIDPYEGLEELTARFEPLGYMTKWINYEKGWTYLTTEPNSPAEVEFHIHIYKRNSDPYKELLLFRDYLRTHKNEREEYGRMKVIWLKESKGVAMMYANLKTEFVKKIIKLSG